MAAFSEGVKCILSWFEIAVIVELMTNSDLDMKLPDSGTTKVKASISRLWVHIPSLVSHRGGVNPGDR